MVEVHRLCQSWPLWLFAPGTRKRSCATKCVYWLRWKSTAFINYGWTWNGRISYDIFSNIDVGPARKDIQRSYRVQDSTGWRTDWEHAKETSGTPKAAMFLTSWAAVSFHYEGCQDSVGGTATRYGLDHSGFEPYGDETFRNRPYRPWDPPIHLYLFSFPGGKAAGAWC